MINIIYDYAIDVINIDHFFKELGQYVKRMQASYDCYEIINIGGKIEMVLSIRLKLNNISTCIVQFDIWLIFWKRRIPKWKC